MQKSYNFRVVFTAACLTMLFFGVSVISLGSILPDLIRQYGLSEIEAGVLTSMLPLGILIGSLVFGPIVDRYSYRPLLIVCVLLIFAGMQTIAFTSSYLLLQLAFVLIGIGGGAINGGASALVADISVDRPESRGANLSFLGVFFGVGALGMPILLGVFEQQYSYNTLIAAIGWFVFLSIFFLAVIRFPGPKHQQGVPFREGLGLLREAPLLLLGFFLFFQSGVEGLVNNWTTTYLEKNLNTEASLALFALGTSVASLTFMRLVLAGLLKKVRRYWVMVISLLLAIAGGLVLLTGIPVLGLALLGAGLAAGFPVMLSFVGDLYSHLSGTAFSLVFVIALIGNIIINFLMGVISQALGIGQFPWILLACLVIMGALLFASLRSIAGKTNI